MNKFDTHGGHYEPQGYMRVNAGGSHEENPNGGVQVGVDPEGTPNLLEEGEPVYNDYVYSDNITADADILRKHNVPFKYGGKLYSEIADTFVDEVAETPLDPIANNGLNAMLVRLADAQEEQKSIQQQRELEEELANLSPEELAELEQMLSQEEAAQQQPMPEEAMQAPVEASIEAPVEQQQSMLPMMANGGDLRRERDSTYQSGSYKGQDKMSVRVKQLSRKIPSHIGIEPLHPLFGRQHPLRLENLLRPFNIYGGALIDTIKDAIEKQEPDSEREPIMQKSEIEKANGGRLNLFALGNPLQRRTHYRSVQWPYGNAYNQFDAPVYDGTDEPITPILEGGNTIIHDYSGPTLLDALYARQKNPLAGLSYTPKTYSVSGVSTSTTAGTSTGRGVNPRYPLYTLSDEDLNAIEADADRGLRRGYDFLPSVDNPYTPGLGRRDANGNTIMYGRPADNPTYAEVNPNLVPREVTSPSLRRVSATPATPAQTASVSDTGMFPTWPRYAGAVTSGLLGLYNAFQEPDRYTTPDYTPVLPEGRMHFIDPVYNPVDQNQMVNDVLASSAGTTRAINNSGLGAATQATLLAQDYNTGRNLGTALATAREANNQRLNQVIAQRNQNAGTLGQFNYGQSRDRAQILNDAAVRNLHNELYRQRLNYEAEGQKYAAIQNQIDSVAQALANIGRENAAMNMINGDEAYAYGLSRLFDPYYKGRIAACGGKIKKTKK